VQTVTVLTDMHSYPGQKEVHLQFSHSAAKAGANAEAKRHRPKGVMV